MATRMGGVVKALVEAFDGHTFLDLRLARERDVVRSAPGAPVPLWLMTSEATEAPTREALAARGAPPHVATFTQDLGLRLTPDGRLFLRTTTASPSTYAPGHGDLPDALRRSGLLSAFVAAGGKYVWIANLDNLGRDHRRRAPRPLHRDAAPTSMVEVAPKVGGRQGRHPRVGRRRGRVAGRVTRRLQVLEEFRLPPGFDAARRPRLQHEHVPRAGRGAAACERPLDAGSRSRRRSGERTAVQFERLLQELTAAMPAAYVARASRGVGGALPPGEGLRRAGETPGATSARWPRRRGML